LADLYREGVCLLASLLKGQLQNILQKLEADSEVSLLQGFQLLGSEFEQLIGYVDIEVGFGFYLLDLVLHDLGNVLGSVGSEDQVLYFVHLEAELA
jgi:hypothetical protein